MKNPFRVAVVLIITLVWANCTMPGPSTVSNDARDTVCSKLPEKFNSQYNREVRYVTADPNLNRLQDFFYPVLSANQKEFAGRSGSVRGFGAGDTYPQIWIRDSATLIPLTRYHYDLDYLKSWLEEHLSHQREDGQLYDWIAVGARTNFVGAAPMVREVAHFNDPADPKKVIPISGDKNTTEADQESSAVAAAYQIFKITGDRQWLNKPINGRSVIDRLNRSLNYLVHNRFDAQHGLIKNAYTADWGDVSPIYADQRAIYWDEKTPSVVGLYTNAMFYNAALQLEELNFTLSNHDLTSYWRLKAAATKQKINEHLWQEDRGFYRTHILLTPKLLPNNWDDSDIFAMGGNALAMLYQIADDRQAQKILATAAQRQQLYGVSTMAGVLLPAYPQGFFKHPAMSEANVYQNGGQWDWFAGRLLLAEFERGYSQRALDGLIEIARKAVKNDGLFEWHDRDGNGRGSPNYAGSAGALAAAIFQGLFGVYLDETALVLKIRLGDQPGQIHLYQPASDHYVSYRYCYDQSEGKVTLEYASNFPKAGRIHILLPRNRQVAASSLDGKELNFETQNVGDETFVVLETDWTRHLLQLTLKD